MTTPFASLSAQDILHELMTLPASGEGDIADLIYQYAEEFSEAFGAFDEGETTELVDKTLCLRVWIGACLLDAVLVGTDYAADCGGFADEYRLAVRELENALNRTKKRLFRKPTFIHNAAKLVDSVYDQLLVIADDSTEIGAGMSEEEFAETVCATGDLCERLEPHLPLYNGGVG